MPENEITMPKNKKPEIVVGKIDLTTLTVNQDFRVYELDPLGQLSIYNLAAVNTSYKLPSEKDKAMDFPNRDEYKHRVTEYEAKLAYNNKQMGEIYKDIVSGISHFEFSGGNFGDLFNLPVELWLMILSHLPVQDLAMVSQVSRVWHNLTRNPKLLSALRTKKDEERYRLLILTPVIISDINNVDVGFFNIRPSYHNYLMPNIFNNLLLTENPPSRNSSEQYTGEHPGIDGQNNGFKMY